MEKELLIGGRIPTILNEHSKENLVVILHIFFGSKNTTKNVGYSNVFNSRNISNLRFDFFGHRNYESNLSNLTLTKALNDLDDVLEFAEKEGYKNIHLIGPSFGGAIGLLQASQNKFNIKSLCLIAPVSDYKKKLEEDMNIEEWQKTGFVEYHDDSNKRLNYSFYEDSLSYDFNSQVSKIKVPTLILHGNADKTVSVEQSYNLTKLISDSQLIIFNNCDHFFREEKFFNLLVDNMTSFVLRKIEERK